MIPAKNPAEGPRVHWGWFIVGCIGFGCLMASRGYFNSIWLRAVVAGIAGGFLAFAMQKARKGRQKLFPGSGFKL
jgi:hypothetical protein